MLWKRLSEATLKKVKTRLIKEGGRSLMALMLLEVLLALDTNLMLEILPRFSMEESRSMTIEALAIGQGGSVDIRSSSKIGDSDLGVNEKQLSYSVASIRKEDWVDPDPAY